MIFQTITRPFDRILAAKHDGRKKVKNKFSRAARIVHVHVQAGVWWAENGFFITFNNPLNKVGRNYI